MAEESHLDEMRSAIRGDFERLADRRGSQDLMRLEEAAGDEPQDIADEHAEPAELLARRSWLARLIAP